MNAIFTYIGYMPGCGGALTDSREAKKQSELRVSGERPFRCFSLVLLVFELLRGCEIVWLSMVVHVCNPSITEMKVEFEYH